MTKDIERAFENGRAWYQTIVEMVADLSKAEDQDNEGGADETEAPRRRIEESPLSVATIYLTTESGRLIFGP